jgi:hypothetical protein
MQLMTKIAHVTDTNGQDLGSMPISVVYDTAGPMQVRHNGKSYAFTGKAGTNSKTGAAVRELATSEDARLWITLDGHTVWED